MAQGRQVQTILPKIPSSLILIVDDDEDTRAVLRFALSNGGHKVIEASDGEQAMEVCRGQLPEAIVTDVMMPGVDGIQFVKMFRKEFAGHYVPILMLTARSEIEQKVEGLEVGADEYLTKPFNYRELLARVSALIRIKVLTDSLLSRTKELETVNGELSRTQEELLKKERELVAVQIAGAAAHSLGQPITAILLNCRLLEQNFNPDHSAGVIGETEWQRAAASVSAIKNECKIVQSVLGKLQSVDPGCTQEYVGEMRIVSLDPGNTTTK
jgi:DNA-binding response OmpR family regulator